jgi:hypothetical protein
MSDETHRATAPRGRFLALSAGAGAAMLLASRAASATDAAVSQAACTDTTGEVLSTLLIVEQVAQALYYTGLTSPGVVGHPYLAGTSADPNQVSSNGSQVNVACFQAALDQERKHAALLQAQGASSSHSNCYFPAHTFQSLGYTTLHGTFLWVLDQLETLTIGAYLSAISDFAANKKSDLAVLCTRIFGPECQHRAIGRSVAGDTPANNMALQVNSFTCAHDAISKLDPYLTGKGFAGGSTKAIPFPSDANMSRIIGKNKSS